MVLKLRASSSSSSIGEQGSSGKFWLRGHKAHPMAEMSEVTGLQLRFPRAAVAKSLPRRTAEPSLDILLYLFGAPRHKVPSFLPGHLRVRG